MTLVERPARFLGYIALFAFAAMLFTVFADPESRADPTGFIPLLVGSLLVGLNETWCNFVRVDQMTVSRVNWLGLQRKSIRVRDLQGVFREDVENWIGRPRIAIVVQAEHSEIRLRLHAFYRDGGWPLKAMSRIVVALHNANAPVDATLLADARNALR